MDPTPEDYTQDPLANDGIQGLPLYGEPGSNNVNLGVGRAWVPGLGKNVTVTTPLTVAMVSGANALAYAYLTETAGAPELVISTTAPDAPYLGTARTMTGDTNKRYLGMVRNDASGNLIPFEMEVLSGATTQVMYHELSNAPVLKVCDQPSTQPATLVECGPSAATAANRLISPAARTAFFCVEKPSTIHDVNVGWPLYNSVPPHFIERLTKHHYTPSLRISPAQELYHAKPVAAGSNTPAVRLYVQSYYERR